MNDYQAALVAAGKRFSTLIVDDYERGPVIRLDTECYAGHAYTEAEAVVVANMLLKGAAELARRREAGK